jgi:hypothetical protein
MGAGAVLAAKAGAGALAGGISSGIQGANDRASLKEYIKQQQQLQGQIGANTTKREGEITTAYAPQLSGMGEDVSNYYDTLRNADFSKYDVSAPEEYKGRDLNELTQQMMNPLTDTMVNTASNKVQGAAANAGGLFSGVTAKNVANVTAQVQAEQYDKARQAAQTQQAQDYQQYTDKFANLLKATENNRGNYASNIGALGSLNTAQTGAFNNQQTNLTGVRNTGDTNLFGSKSAEAEAAAKKAGIGSTFSNFAQGAMGGLSSALG